MPDFLPRPDRSLLNWSRVFRDGISAGPERVGLSLIQCEHYGDLHEAYAEALKLATEPMTRSTHNVIRKNEKRDALKAEARILARIVRAVPGLTPADRVGLGLTVDKSPSPVGPPDQVPRVRIVSVHGHRITVRLDHDIRNGRRCKPHGVYGALLFGCVGDAPKADLIDWISLGRTTVTTATVQFPGNVPRGSRVWIAAAWLSPRLESGDVSRPTGTHIGFEFELLSHAA